MADFLHHRHVLSPLFLFLAAIKFFSVVVAYFSLLGCNADNMEYLERRG